MGPDGAIYVNQGSIICRSTDGGRTWTSYPRQEGPSGTFSFKVLSNGTFIAAGPEPPTDVKPGPVGIWASGDEGRTWKLISQIEIPEKFHARWMYTLSRLPDDTLLCGVVRAARKRDEKGNYVSGANTLVIYRSTDQGKTWSQPVKVRDWGYEGGITHLPSGKLLAAIRVQRFIHPTDTPEFLSKYQSGKMVYKIIFLADSGDQGRTWKNVRQLTTVFGQCYGYPAALSDGTVVVVHDTRYGPGAPSGRAIISHDEGATWQDEVYYVYYGIAQSGYSESVVLDDDTIVTIAGVSDYTAGNGSWEAWTGNTDLWAIRWRPVRD